jgi:hypothetical protein
MRNLGNVRNFVFWLQLARRSSQCANSLPSRQRFHQGKRKGQAFLGFFRQAGNIRAESNAEPNIDVPKDGTNSGGRRKKYACVLHILKRKSFFDLHGVEVVKAVLEPKGQDTEDGG